jgi:hypothetical protein
VPTGGSSILKSQSRVVYLSRLDRIDLYGWRCSYGQVRIFVTLGTLVSAIGPAVSL